MTLWEYYFGMLFGLLLESLNAVTGFNAVTVCMHYSLVIYGGNFSPKGFY